MARTIRNPKIDSRSARAKLPQRPEPYWTVISEGCALGYRRGSKGGKWIARFRDSSEFVNEQCVRHLWHCINCNAEFEMSAYFPTDTNPRISDEEMRKVFLSDVME